MHHPKHASEVPFFFGDPSEPNFGVLHEPSVDGAYPAGIVLCSPLAHEFDFSHRMLVEFARTLSNAGIWVLRFDYRGHGDSFGAFADYALADYREDIRRAIRALEDRAGVPCQGLCGLRLGATLAASVWAEDNRPGPLVLWEPVAQGSRFLDDLLRAIVAKNMTHSTGEKTTREILRQHIAQGEPVIFEGRFISPGLARSLEALDLASACQRLSQPTLLVQMSRRPTTNVAAPLRKLHDALSTHCPVELQTAVLPVPWFGSLVLDYSGRIYPRTLFQQTQDWIWQQLTKTPTQSPATTPVTTVTQPEAPTQSARPLRTGKSRSSPAGHERPVEFVVDGVRCSGMLHGSPLKDSHRPLIVMPPQGMNLRSGWNQLHTRLARMLGEAGWSSLRFDARGLGQSAGTLDFVSGADLFSAVETGLHVPDTRAAIAFAEHELGVRSVILIGVCGGAVTAGYLAAEDPRVAAAALVELPLVCAPRNPEESEGMPLWRYRDKLMSVDAWRRLLALQFDFRFHLQSMRMAAGRLARRRGQSRVDEGWLIDQLGATANVDLAGAVARCCSRGVPVLFAFGSTDNAQFFERVRERLLPPDAPRVWRRTIDGADHDFLSPWHTQTLGETLLDWLENACNFRSKANVHETCDYHPELPHA
jgi:uncharacterized protein